MTTRAHRPLDEVTGGSKAVSAPAPRQQTSVLRLCIQALGDSLPSFHEFVQAMLARSLRPATASRVAACASELLDNALAYATLSNDIVLEIRLDALNVFVEVENDAVRSRVRMLQERVEELKKDPEAVYLEAMRRSMSARTARSTMGLARVRHEAQMELSVEVKGDRVTVLATGKR